MKNKILTILLLLLIAFFSIGCKQCYIVVMPLEKELPKFDNRIETVRDSLFWSPEAAAERSIKKLKEHRDEK